MRSRLTSVEDAVDTQAGEHPYEFTTSVDFNSENWELYVVNCPRMFMSMSRLGSMDYVLVDLPLGFVGLISIGQLTGRIGVSACHTIGSEVFFLTRSESLPQDQDDLVDVYDAHECTAGSPCVASSAEQPPACEGDACQSPTPQPGIFGAPASATFSGPGNLTPPTPVSPAKPKTPTRAQLLAKALKACRKKHNPHKRLACQKQAHKRYPSKSSKGRK
jgi:hypothetical protein